MQSLPLKPKLKIILRRYRLQTKFQKAVNLFLQNPRHPSLHTEKLHPQHLDLYSFRLDRRWRVIFIFPSINNLEVIEIIDINLHYND